MRLLFPLLVLGVLAAPALVRPPALAPLASATDFAITRCPGGEVVTGFDSADRPECASPLAAAACPEGELLAGFGPTGAPVCGAPATTMAAPAQLKVIDVYGLRPDASHDLTALRVELSLGAGSGTLDVARLVVRYADATSVRTLDASSGLSSVWVRGTGAGGIMRPGDLVDLTFDLPRALPPRADALLAIRSSDAPAVDLSLKTPPTYGSDTVVLIQ